ncbi:hypothetical protein JHK82_033494 [Glycine max]|uniref:Transcription activator GLK1 n=1 Tax=Glycine soja TaxID=3848 RepID=A0A0B2PMF1_GLYSO|nr:transcription activator GLK1-like [Glycine soja]KAG5119074.1 hypothetical protein JHK82_033494 [Glycine max]KAG5140067.1 hypothetical protein JHK84_033835 [Glycine max]KHN08803.1 Transcription activator GLK1 [Glycine soja]RZB75449.1 Transcription activator GLK1 [Glycine soja]
MLAVSPLRSIKDEKNQGEMEGNFSMATTTTTGDVDFGDLSEGNLLESINFDDLFVGIDINGDVLPDLEMFHEFSVDVNTGEESSEMNSSADNSKVENDQNVMINTGPKKEEEEDKASCNSSGQDLGSIRGEEIVSKRDESVVVNPAPKDGGKGRKSSSAQSKNNNSSNNAQGKRKVKVDWTPELHRRFVQAVEQLGVDKAVPSRILEIMGIDCLTRHNIASHLQKYRSHRKHLLAREAEAASWSQRRQLYAGGGKREGNPWLAPIMGFPPMTTPMHHFRPLHVWGHPSMSLVHMWPKHLSNSPPLLWPLSPPAVPPQDPSFWQQLAPNALIPGTACFPQPLTPTRFGSPPVPGIPPHAMYKADHGIGVLGPSSLLDFHPSKECIDAAIGDVLSKPWLPLPIGLKAPALDSVMSELQKQGIPNIPPSSA